MARPEAGDDPRPLAIKKPNRTTLLCPSCEKPVRLGSKPFGHNYFGEAMLRGALLCKNKACDVDEVRDPDRI